MVVEDLSKKQKSPRNFLPQKSILMKKKKEEIHIGNIIKQTLKEKDFKMAWLARKVNCEEGNFCKKLKNNVISKELLYNISDVLRVDFFAYYSDDLTKKWKKNP